MIDYREIIRLKNLKFSNVAIANSLCCSRNTVSEVLKLAESHSLEWPIPETLTNKDIEQLFYPDVYKRQVVKSVQYFLECYKIVILRNKRI